MFRQIDYRLRSTVVTLKMTPLSHRIMKSLWENGQFPMLSPSLPAYTHTHTHTNTHTHTHAHTHMPVQKMEHVLDHLQILSLRASNSLQNKIACKNNAYDNEAIQKAIPEIWNMKEERTQTLLTDPRTEECESVGHLGYVSGRGSHCICKLVKMNGEDVAWHRGHTQEVKGYVIYIQKTL